MNLVNLLKGLLNLQKKIDIKILPSQGLFYKDDFEITIKKADVEDIIEYEYNYIKDDLGSVIFKLKKVVELLIHEPVDFIEQLELILKSI